MCQEWSEITGMGYGTLITRIDRLHWNVKKALERNFSVFKVCFLLCAILLCSSCSSTVVSDSIANNAIKELNGVTQAVQHIQATTPAECMSNALTANLNAIKTQVESVSGQIKNISLACTTEKQVLENKITIRELIIGILAAIIGLFIFIFVRRK